MRGSTTNATDDEPDHLEHEPELHDARDADVAGEVAAELRPDDDEHAERQHPEAVGLGAEVLGVLQEDGEHEEHAELAHRQHARS